MPFVGVDTALQNIAVAVLADDGHRVLSVRKPFPDGKVMDGMERMLYIRDFLERELHTEIRPVMVALEDYPMSPFNDAYLTAELLGLMKAMLHDVKQNYCLVHPMKTHKFVVKKRKVTKTEIIDYVKANFDLSGVELDRRSMSDGCDAIVIAAIGRLTWKMHDLQKRMIPPDPDLSDEIRKVAPEERWREILLTDNSGILTKPGLAQFF